MPCFKLFIVFLLLVPICSYAQDTTFLKKQASRFAKASFNGDYKTVLDLTYPGLIAYAGGRDSLQKLMADRIAALKKQGVMTIDGSVGAPGPFFAAGEELHCLIPETLILKIFNGHYLTTTYLLAISKNKGQSWTFMDVGKMPADVLQRLIPTYNPYLRIPPPGKPLFFAD